MFNKNSSFPQNLKKIISEDKDVMAENIKTDVL